jgi:hypothetical protein
MYPFPSRRGGDVVPQHSPLVVVKQQEALASKISVAAINTKNNSSTAHIPLQQKYQTTKTSCVLQSEYNSKTQEELKAILLQKAKAESLEELYGTLIKTNLELQNEKITKDEVQQLSLGNIRVLGKPQFFNGKNWGEVCTTLTAYITEDDFTKYKPQTIYLRDFCYNNPQIPTTQIKQNSNYSAYKTAIAQFKPAMKDISNTQAESFIHGFQKSNERFDFQTGVYCFDAALKLMPYEFELQNVNHVAVSDTQQASVKKNDMPSSKHGLKVYFYQAHDQALREPIYQTSLESGLWLKKKSFVNSQLQFNRPYWVKIEGNILHHEDIEALRLLHNVYTASVKIDGQEVLNEKKHNANISIKGGKPYKLSIVVKTSNTYDVALLAKSKGRSNYETLGLGSLYQ